MNKTIFAILSAFALSAVGSSALSLRPGMNESAAGQIAAFEAITVSNAQSLAVYHVAEITERTNAFATVVTPTTRYSFALTNWNGEAYVATNLYGYGAFRYSDWIDAGGTNHLISAVMADTIPVTNTVPAGTLPGTTYHVTNIIFSASAAGHYLMATNPAMQYLSGAGKIIVTGATPADTLTLIFR